MRERKRAGPRPRPPHRVQHRAFFHAAHELLFQCRVLNLPQSGQKVIFITRKLNKKIMYVYE